MYIRITGRDFCPTQVNQNLLKVGTSALVFNLKCSPSDSNEEPGLRSLRAKASSAFFYVRSFSPAPVSLALGDAQSSTSLFHAGLERTPFKPAFPFPIMGWVEVPGSFPPRKGCLLCPGSVLHPPWDTQRKWQSPMIRLKRNLAELLAGDRCREAVDVFCKHTSFCPGEQEGVVYWQWTLCIGGGSQLDFKI